MYFAEFACTTALGVSAHSTFSAMAAQVSGYRASHFTCGNKRPATMALLDDGLMLSLEMSTEFTGAISEQMIRSAKLMFFALDDLNHRITLPAPAPLIWLGDEQQGQKPLDQTFIRTILGEYEAPIQPKATYFIDQGRASGIGALKLAHQLLHEKNHDYVIMGSVNSLADTAWLEALDNKQRLKNEDAKDAFAPGEGSAFLVLAKTPALANAHKQTSPVAIQCCLPGIARSPSHWFNHEQHSAQALSDAVQQAHQFYVHASPQLAHQPLNCLVTSLNGELFWAKEHGIAVMRMAQQCGNAQVYHSAEYLGDLGPLCGLFNIGHGAHLLATQTHQNALLYASSDGPWRAACILTTAT